jgi:hypothetical protein
MAGQTVGRSIMLAWTETPPVMWRPPPRSPRRCGPPPTGGVDDAHLADAGVPVGGHELGERFLGGSAGRQELDPLEPVARIDEGLGGDRADARPEPRHERAHGKPAGLHGDAELTGPFIECHDREVTAADVPGGAQIARIAARPAG